MNKDISNVDNDEKKSILNGAVVLEWADPLPGDIRSPELLDQAASIVATAMHHGILAVMALLNSELLKSDSRLIAKFTPEQREVHALAEKALNHLPARERDHAESMAETLFGTGNWSAAGFKPNTYLEIKDLCQQMLVDQYTFLGCGVTDK